MIWAQLLANCKDFLAVVFLQQRNLSLLSTIALSVPWKFCKQSLPGQWGRWVGECEGGGCGGVSTSENHLEPCFVGLASGNG